MIQGLLDPNSNLQHNSHSTFPHSQSENILTYPREGLIESIPQEHITPISTIIKAYDTFLTNDNSSGETVEVSQDKLFFRRHVEYPNESQRWLNEADFWRLMYDQKMAKAARL